MDRYIKLIVGNAAFAAVLICLYSPGLVGLSFSSPNAVMAAASVAIGVVAVPAFVLMNKSLLAEKKVALLEADGEKAGERAAALLEDHRSGKVLGPIAKSALSQMQRLENVGVNYEKLVVQRFGMGTLSYEKFMGVVRSASEALEKGYVKMANKMIIFDEAEYQHLSSDAYHHDAIPDQVQEEKKALYDGNLASLRQILEKNEKILLEVDHLMAEMSDLEQPEQAIDQAAAQIDGLLAQLGYYRQ